jgi:ABC-type cobalt transport system substrate-binding protein
VDLMDVCQPWASPLYLPVVGELELRRFEAMAQGKIGF